MKHFISESEALESLNITGFDQINSGNFMKFVGLFKELDPDTAKLALSQITDFTKLVMSTLDYYKHNYDRNVDCIMQTHSDYHVFCSRITDILAKMSENPDNNSEDKASIIRALLELETRRSERDRQVINDIKEEREECNNRIGSVVKVVVTGLLFGLAIVLGTRGPKNESQS